MSWECILKNYQWLPTQCKGKVKEKTTADGYREENGGLGSESKTARGKWAESGVPERRKRTNNGEELGEGKGGGGA